MKRSVFILILFPAGPIFSTLTPAPITLPPIVKCDVLQVNPKIHFSRSNLRASADRNRKKDLLLIANDKYPAKSSILIYNETVGTLSENDYIKLVRLVSQNRTMNLRHKFASSKLIKTLIKVPP